MIKTSRPGATAASAAIVAVLVLSIAPEIGPAAAHAQTTITHDTQSAFAAGSFVQTVLAGTEQAPQIRLDVQPTWVWAFEDTEISGETDRRLVGGDLRRNIPIGTLERGADRDPGEIVRSEQIVGDIDSGSTLAVTTTGDLARQRIVLGEGNVKELAANGEAEVAGAARVEYTLDRCVCYPVVVNERQFGELEQRTRSGVGVEEARVAGDCRVGLAHALELSTGRDDQRWEDRETGITSPVGGVIADCRVDIRKLERPGL